MTKPAVEIVWCFWEYRPPADGRGSPWHLAETAVNITFRDAAIDAWMHARDNDDDDGTEIMGRTVTCWTMAYGVRLSHFHPPEWVPWLAAEFYDELTRNPNGVFLVERGIDMHRGTVDAARKALEGGT